MERSLLSYVFGSDDTKPPPPQQQQQQRSTVGERAVNTVRDVSVAPSVSSGALRTSAPKLSVAAIPPCATESSDNDDDFFESSSPLSIAQLQAAPVVPTVKASAASQMAFQQPAQRQPEHSSSSSASKAANASSSSATLGLWRADGTTPHELIPPQTVLEMRERVGNGPGFLRIANAAIAARGDSSSFLPSSLVGISSSCSSSDAAASHISKNKTRRVLPLQDCEVNPDSVFGGSAAQTPWMAAYDVMPRCQFNSVLEGRFSNVLGFVLPSVDVRLLDEDEEDDITEDLAEKIFVWKDHVDAAAATATFCAEQSSRNRVSVGNSNDGAAGDHHHQQQQKMKHIAGFRICFNTALTDEIDGLRFRVRLTLEAGQNARRSVLTSSKIMLRFTDEQQQQQQRTGTDVTAAATGSSSNNKFFSSAPGSLNNKFSASSSSSSRYHADLSAWSQNSASYAYWSRGVLRPEDRICDAVFIDPGRSNSLLSTRPLSREAVMDRLNSSSSAVAAEDSSTTTPAGASQQQQQQPPPHLRDRMVSSRALMHRQQQQQQQQPSSNGNFLSSRSSNDSVIFLGKTTKADAAAAIATSLSSSSKRMTNKRKKQKQGDQKKRKTKKKNDLDDHVRAVDIIVDDQEEIIRQQPFLQQLLRTDVLDDDHDGFFTSSSSSIIASASVLGQAAAASSSSSSATARLLGKNKNKSSNNHQELSFSPADGGYAGLACEREVLCVDGYSDPQLQRMVRETADVHRCHDTLYQAKSLCLYVALAMGGFPVDDAAAESHVVAVRREIFQREAVSFRQQQHCQQGQNNVSTKDGGKSSLLKPRESAMANVVHLGELRNALCRHRAVLLKFLADSHRLPMFLVRGEYHAEEEEEEEEPIQKSQQQKQQDANDAPQQRPGRGRKKQTAATVVEPEDKIFPHVWCVCPLVDGLVLLDPTLSPNEVLPWPNRRYVPQQTQQQAGKGNSGGSTTINIENLFSAVDFTDSTQHHNHRRQDTGVASIAVEDSKPVLQEEIGRGANAVVHRMDVGPFSVAAKIPLHAEQDLPALRREFTLLQTLHSVRCPGVPRVVGWHGGILMEYFPTSLLGFMNSLAAREQCLGMEQRQDVARGLLSTLAFLHTGGGCGGSGGGGVDRRRQQMEERILHRDIKAENVVLLVNRCRSCQSTSLQCPDCSIVPHLVDFADAVRIPLHEPQHGSLPRVGTPPYTAPEILLEKPFDCAADMWSVGMLLVEMQIMQLPSVEAGCGGVVQRLSRFSDELHVFIPETEDEENPSLGQIAKQCLQLDPAKRISAVDALAMLRRRGRQQPQQLPEEEEED